MKTTILIFAGICLIFVTSAQKNYKTKSPTGMAQIEDKYWLCRIMDYYNGNSLSCLAKSSKQELLDDINSIYFFGVIFKSDKEYEQFSRYRELNYNYHRPSKGLWSFRADTISVKMSDNVSSFHFRILEVSKEYMILKTGW